ncbi:MAG: hypothetical protein U5K36_04915 [Roseovarius sp.]|nr:hypothetical protein [Roseovarius sp.]
MRRYYDDWADSYDTDLRENDYRTPGRLAAGALPPTHLDDRHGAHLRLRPAETASISGVLP